MKCVALAILLLVPAATPAQNSGGDQQLKTRVEQRLTERRVRGIKVAAQGGSVTLAGNIASAGAKQDLINDVLKVEGVKEIVSELTIGKAENDQKLAERIADQMRRSSYFTVFDDVEIGVDNGVVTLTGYVTQPIKSSNSIDGWDSVLSILQMPNGVPVATVALNADRKSVV